MHYSARHYIKTQPDIAKPNKTLPKPGKADDCLASDSKTYLLSVTKRSMASEMTMKK